MPRIMIWIIVGVVAVSILLIIWASHAQFKRTFQLEAKKILALAKNEQVRMITEDDLKKLPKIVQKYLKYAQVIGKPMIKTIRLKQKGFLRQGENEPWYPLEAQEYFSAQTPAFTWLGKIQINGLMFVTGKDRYLNQKGGMWIKLLSLYPIANVKGHEIDHASLTRYMNEMMWFPTAYLSEKVKWETIDALSARMILSDGGITASALLYFDQDGRLVNFVCDRYRAVGEKMVLTPWHTPVSGYAEKNGFKIPTKGEGVWKLPSGDFSYIKLELEKIEYNPKEIYE